MVREREPHNSLGRPIIMFGEIWEIRCFGFDDDWREFEIEQRRVSDDRLPFDGQLRRGVAQIHGAALQSLFHVDQRVDADDHFPN